MPPALRKPTARRREEIAAAVLALLGRGGPRALTTAALADAVGVTTGALFRHFATLDEMLEAAVALAVERLEATFPPRDLPPLARLRALARARVEALRAEPGLAWLLRSEQAVASLPAPAVRRLAAFVRRSRRTLLDTLEEAAAAGEVRRDVPPDLLLVPFTATVHALVGPGGVHARKVPRPDAVLDALFVLLAPP